MKPEEAIPLLQRGLTGEIYDEKGYLTALGYEALEAIDISNCKTLVQKEYGECGTCKHFVKGGLDGKTYVCEHPSIEQDDYFNYAFLTMDEKDFCSCYENYEKKEGEKLENDRRGVPGIPEEDEKAE